MLKNKVIVITGGNGLIGKEIISKLKKEGATVINLDITLNDNIDNGEIYCNISDVDSVLGAIKKIESKYSKIYGWINNAYPRTNDWNTEFEEISYDSWKNNIDLHLNGYFLCSQKILKKMRLQREGSLINMASIYGVVGPDFSLYKDIPKMTMPAAYSAIKGGIISLTKYLASYYGEYNVRVNCVSPGGVFDNQNEKFVKRYIDKVPMKRMANAGEIADSIIFLLTSSYITGHNLIVDGGFTIT